MHKNYNKYFLVFLVKIKFFIYNINMKIKFKKLANDVIGITMPAIIGDAGYDLYAADNYNVKAKSSISIKTGIAVELPDGYWMEIMPKSGLATKNDIAVHNGVIDNGYRGEIIVHVYNHSSNDYSFNKNDKIAQAIIRKLHVFDLEETNELTETKRQDRGFGSTGK